MITKQMQQMILKALWEENGKFYLSLGNCRLDFSKKYLFLGFTKNSVKLADGWRYSDNEKIKNVFGKISFGNDGPNGEKKYFKVYTEGHSYSERFIFPTKEEYQKEQEETKMKKESKKEKASETVSAAEIEKKAKDKAPANVEKKTMTIGETKLGLTLVISKEDCKKLGFKETQTTKEAIFGIKTKLGIA